MEIDVVEMPVEQRKGPPPLPILILDPDLLTHNSDPDLDKRRKLQKSLSYSIAYVIFLTVVMTIIGFSVRDFLMFCAIGLVLVPAVLIPACVRIGRTLYLLATTPRSITKAAFRDRNYWYSFFLIDDKPPEDYCREMEGSHGVNDLQKSRQESKDSQRESTRDGEMLLAFPLVIATLFFSILVLAPKIVLIGHYGWTKVQQEHLHFLDMPKGHPWPVSNGDKLDIGFAHYIVSVICWFGLFIPLYSILRLLLPKRKKPK